MWTFFIPEPISFHCSVCSVVYNSLWPYGLQPTRLLCPWNFPGNNTGMGYHFLLQGVFLTQRSNLHLLHLQVNSFRLSHLENSLFFLIHPAIPKVNLKKKKERERESISSLILICLLTASFITSVMLKVSISKICLPLSLRMGFLISW